MAPMGEDPWCGTGVSMIRLVYMSQVTAWTLRGCRSLVVVYSFRECAVTTRGDRLPLAKVT